MAIHTPICSHPGSEKDPPKSSTTKPSSCHSSGQHRWSIQSMPGATCTNLVLEVMSRWSLQRSETSRCQAPLGYLWESVGGQQIQTGKFRRVTVGAWQYCAGGCSTANSSRRKVLIVTMIGVHGTGFSSVKNPSHREFQAPGVSSPACKSSNTLIAGSCEMMESAPTQRWILSHRQVRG